MSRLIVLLAAGLAAGVVWVLAGVPGARPDFLILWAAGHGGRVYGSGLFAYPPSALPLFAALARLPARLAIALWAGASAGVLIAVSRSRFAPLLLLSPAVVWALVAGQTSILVGAALYAGLQLRSRPWLAGALIGVALCVKPQLGVFVPVGLLMDRRWRELASLALTGAGLVAVAALLYGPAIWLDWLSALPRFMAINQGLAERMIAADLPLSLKLAALICGLCLMWRAFRIDDPAAQLVTAVSTGLLVSPHGLIYDLAALAPAALALALRRDWRLVPAVAFLAAPAAWSLALLALGATFRRPFAMRPTSGESPSGSVASVHAYCLPEKYLRRRADR